METLPQEIISNILCRLPVKHLVQLKRVCKPWKSLISDPEFAKLHLQAPSLNDYRVLLLNQPLQSVACEASADDLGDIETNLILEFPFPAAMKDTPESDELIKDYPVSGGSCNGLVCAVFDRHQRIFVLNPTLREAMELAKPTDFNPEVFFGRTFRYGLGYDSSTDDYKVVRTAGSCSSTAYASGETQVEILTLRSNVWRKIQCLQRGIEIERFDAGIFLHGALHWTATNRTAGKATYGIIAFDLLEEKFHELVPIPDELDKGFRTLMTSDLAISGDCLCLFSGTDYDFSFEGWVMKEYGIKSSWTRLFRVESNVVYRRCFLQTALCYTKSGKVLIEIDRLDRMVLKWYDPKENTSKTFTPHAELDLFSSVIYVESLVSPNHYSAANM